MMKKRILAMLMTLAMMLGMLPTVALATTSTDEMYNCITDAEIVIGDGDGFTTTPMIKLTENYAGDLSDLWVKYELYDSTGESDPRRGGGSIYDREYMHFMTWQGEGMEAYAFEPYTFDKLEVTLVKYENEDWDNPVQEGETQTFDIELNVYECPSNDVIAVTSGTPEQIDDDGYRYTQITYALSGLKPSMDYWYVDNYASLADTNQSARAYFTSDANGEATIVDCDYGYGYEKGINADGGFIYVETSDNTVNQVAQKMILDGDNTPSTPNADAPTDLTLVDGRGNIDIGWTQYADGDYTDVFVTTYDETGKEIAESIWTVSTGGTAVPVYRADNQLTDTTDFKIGKIEVYFGIPDTNKRTETATLNLTDPISVNFNEVAEPVIVDYAGADDAYISFTLTGYDENNKWLHHTSAGTTDFVFHESLYGSDKDGDGAQTSTLIATENFNIADTNLNDYNLVAYNQTDLTALEILIFNLEATSDLPSQTLVWDETPTTTATYGDGTFTETATLTTGDGTITYASNDETVATVNETSGEVTIVGAGEATITATAAATEAYCETTASYTITVAQKAPTAGDFNVTIPTGLTYGDTITATTVEAKTGITGMGAVTVYYDGETAIPTDAGDYIVTYDVAEGTNYSAITNLDAGTLTIGKCTSVSNGTATSITLPKSNIVFPEIDITGVDEETVAVVVSNYAIGSDNYNTVTELETALATATSPVTVKYTYNYNDSNYDISTTFGEIEITIVDIAFSATDDAYITISETPTYGDSWDDILTVNDITATVGEATGTGTYSIDVTGTPDAADDQAYTLTYTGTIDGVAYTGITVTTGTVNVVPKALTIAVSDDSVYRGYDLPTAITLIYTGLVTGDSFSTAPTFTLTDSEGATLENSNTNGAYIITWTNPEAFTDSNYTITTETSATLTISIKPSSGGGGGSSPNTGNDNSVSTNTNGDATASVESNSSSTLNGTTTSKVTQDTLEKAISDVVEATKDGTANVEIVAKTASNADAVAVELPADALSTLAESDVETLTIASDLGTMALSSEAAASIASQAGEGANVAITIGQADVKQDLNPRQQAVVGDQPVFDLSVTADGEYITHFDGGEVAVSVPYELKDGESADGIVVWYLDDDGNLDVLFASYDEKTEQATFTTTHFSYYVVAHNSLYATEHNFSDVDINAYYYLPMLWAIENGITSGTSGTTFSPDTSCTRAQALTFLYRAAGEPEVTGDCIFTDVSTDAYYYDAVLWAVENGITAGTSDTTFSPDTVCSRSQIVTFLYRASDEPTVTGGTDFTDVIADSYYADAVRWAVSEEITSGTSATTFSPDANCTRGQIVTFLYRNMEE